VRAWCFTINNPDDNDTVAVDTFSRHATVQYFCYAPETGDSGTPHLQGYVYLKEAKTRTAVNRALGGRAHLEAANGDSASNRAYIAGPWTGKNPDGSPKTKPANTAFVEHGVQPKQGKRTDMETVREAVKAGASMLTIIDEARSLQSIRTAEVLFKYLDKPRSEMTELHWLWGPTGTGKSHTAWTQAGPEAYAPVSSKWWDGYDRHECVVIDDCRPEWFEPIGGFAGFLKLVDKWPYKVESKGSSRHFVAKRLYITCPMSPDDFWHGQTEENINQFKRRITSVQHLCVRHVASTV